jgi:hypothetical protein
LQERFFVERAPDEVRCPSGRLVRRNATFHGWEKGVHRAPGETCARRILYGIGSRNFFKDDNNLLFFCKFGIEGAANCQKTACLPRLMDARIGACDQIPWVKVLQMGEILERVTRYPHGIVSGRADPSTTLRGEASP